MALLISNFRNLQVDEAWLKTSRVLLGDLSNKYFMGAIVKLCQNHQEIYANTNIVALIRQEAINFTDTNLFAEEAWACVMAKFKGINSIEITELTEKTVQALGGWKEIGITQTDQLGVLRAHFLRIYQAYVKRNEINISNEQVNQLLEMVSEKHLLA